MWINSLKQHVENEIAYSPAMKTHLFGLMDSVPEDEPISFLSALIERINGAGQFRSREFCKFLSRIRYRYQQEAKGKGSETAKLELLDNIVIGRV